MDIIYEKAVFGQKSAVRKSIGNSTENAHNNLDEEQTAEIRSCSRKMLNKSEKK